MSKHGMTNPHAARQNEARQKNKSDSKVKSKVQNVEKKLQGATAAAEPGGRKISLASASAPEVVSGSDNVEQPPATPPVATPDNPARSTKHMDLKLVRSTAPRKDARLVIYNIEGRVGSVQFLSSLFGGTKDSQGNPPESLVLSGTFVEAPVKVEKAKETPEQRKARLAALPKLTLAEKVARAEKRTADLRAKLAKTSAG